MNGSPLQRLRDIVLAAADLGEAERRAYLDRACAGDPELRREAERLLAADHGTVGIVESGLASLVHEYSGRPDLAMPQVGDSLGPYRLARLLGAGGSGVVYEATQETPVRRRVAVKLLHRNRTLSADLARFRAEQQILAHLEHPHIAQVFDAGTTAQGVPYFVLELVDGRPITQHVEERNASLAECLDLCLQACRAAEHAHAKGVIHRDLKPANVLVSDTNEGPLVKVIDFGIARLLETDDDEAITLEGVHLGTPEYMSPEQAGGGSAGCDVKTDVHALGNLLHVVLCGRGVYDVGNLSTPRQLRAVASGRRQLATRDARGNRLPSDLRRIIDMATDPDPERRYRTAAALAEDVERFRTRRPVAARGAGTGYLLRKAAERNPVATVMLALMLAVAVCSFAALLNFNARERKAVRRARAESARSSGLASYLAGMMELADPSQLGRDVTLIEAFDDATRRADIELERDPGTLVRVLKTIAHVDLDLDRNSEAIAALDRAEAALARDPGGTDADFYDLKLVRAAVETSVGNLAAGDSIIDQVLAAAHGCLNLAAIEGRALVEKARKAPTYAAGDSIASIALALLRSAGDADRDDITEAIQQQAICEYKLGARDESIALLRDLLASCERDLGPDHPTTIGVVGDLANFLNAEYPDESIALHERALAANIRLLGADHPEIAVIENNLAFSLAVSGNPVAARPHMEHAWRIWRQRFTAANPDLALAEVNLARICGMLGEVEESDEHLRRALSMYLELAKPSCTSRAITAFHLHASNLLSAGRLTEAESEARRGLALVNADIAGDISVAWTHYILGSALLEEGRYDEAVAEFIVTEEINRASSFRTPCWND